MGLYASKSSFSVSIYVFEAFRSNEEIRDSIQIDNITITHQSGVKLFGITIDDKPKFTKHVDIL